MHADNFLEDLQGIHFDDFLKKFPLNENDILNCEDSTDNNKSDYLSSSVENNDVYNKNNFILLLANNILDDSSKIIPPLRRVYWPLLLGIYKYNNLEELTKEIEKKRNLYKRDKDEYITKQINLDIQKLDPRIFHPLSSDDKNPWTLKQKNQELNNEIKQDILRTYSEKKIFQDEKIRDILNKILFIWAKKNPSISYKQGMNEIVAIFFIVNYREQIMQNDISNSCDNKKYYKEYLTLFKNDEVESDTYIIFDHFMNMGLKYLFSSREDKKTQLSKNSCKTVLLQKCTYIFHKLLKNLDKQLYNHLISLSIEPQIFLLRWVRLFYCREFPIDDTIILWDIFFSDCYAKNWKNGFEFDFKGDIIEIAHMTSEVFPLIDYFSISMVLFIKTFLLENDENSCLKRLFKYPPVENIRILIDLSIKLRQKYEKKEKIIKKEEFQNPNNIFNNNFGSNNIGSNQIGGNNYITNTGSINNISPLSSNRNSNTNNNLSTFKIKTDINKNNINNINDQINERHKYINVSSLSQKIKNVNIPNSLNTVNSKLNKVINNLNNLSYNVLNPHHRGDLQQNIFNLNEILKELKYIEQISEEKMENQIEFEKKNDEPYIYLG
ncbi:GTPase-activating protein, putative [Plasmodium berghei]|uniref:GTPase-activating protein, putative n=2 Tax=Plasmodium berghei TaxID=5821 RepID=A0A509AQ84_PLABA|nr:GTPase-activating protein, putative [Plasmodium berghei ANKA]CXI97682.1 GTPase-activating protein, putative [Plasmodium berghei]SCL97575.1 GTPase-activating protein, putative [Plasmodium berghei]SCM16637.1 GTPase-activating protein, putative [Plasmodium berghei]SCM18434.1 GTPase-activating protein, putative [Plasmodium berghei]SCN27865.1 GTPase-activating protein, putative [Plasmodium berghei]|eukprot:XP_034423519.1 GTPase-activating protein, putative [Plasmodium berghei ANKA]